MTPFAYHRAETLAEAATAAAEPGTSLIAGGTTMVDLMRGGVFAPARVVDISRVPGHDAVAALNDGISFGALARMADVAEHPAVRRDFPVLAQSLQQAASQQLRNMATLGGNLLQRTRCGYFRDGRSPCNKLSPGSGCAALDGANREHAVLGGSDACIATYPGDWAVALAAFDTEVDLVSAGGNRSVRLADLHREPGDTPERETNLLPGDVIAAIRVPASAASSRSTYLKLRDRQSYAFAIASAAVALEMQGDMVVTARIAIGGIATRPWRSTDAEAALQGRRLTEASALEAGRAAFAAAEARGANRFKIELGPRVVARALLNAGGGTAS